MKNLVKQLPEPLKDELIVTLLELVSAISVTKKVPPASEPVEVLMVALAATKGCTVIPISMGPGVDPAQAMAEAEAAINKAATKH